MLLKIIGKAFAYIRKSRLFQILFPTVLGLSVVVWLFWGEFDPAAFRSLRFTWTSALFLFCAILCMVGRDAGYMWRIRILSDKQLKWRQAFRVIMLWEFTSCVTPSAVGGTSVAVIYVNKEGLSVGHSSAIVMATSLLDELYFIIMFPLLILMVGSGALFSVASEQLAHNLFLITIIGYSLKLAWVLLLSYGMFINPYGLSRLIKAVFKLPVLRRWQEGADKAGRDIIKSAVMLRRKNFLFWLKASLSTFISWTSRYWVVNMLFLAFFAVNDHMVIFARQLVMFLAQLIAPTPGASGVAEWLFKDFLGDFIPVAGITMGFALLWRLITYYPYLFIGVVLFPKWLVDKFGKKKKESLAPSLSKGEGE